MICTLDDAPRHLVWFFFVLFGMSWTDFPVGAEEARWPQFRGPSGQGYAFEATPPTEWSEEKNVRWRTEIPGLGHSSPVLWDDQVWLTTSSVDGKTLSLIGLDRGTGKILHDVAAFAVESVVEIHAKNSHASPTPVIEAGRVYAHFGTNGAVAVDTATGAILWKNQKLKIEHGGGPGSSPILFKDLLIVTSDGADRQFVAAIDTATGEFRWERPRSAPYRPDPITHRAFATPLIITHEGKPQLISPAADQLHAYDPATGRELWHVRYTGFSTVPCPAYSDGVIYMCTGYFGPEMAAIKVDGLGNVTDSHVLWHIKKGVPENPSPLIHEGRIFFVSDKGIATAVEAGTGKQIWSRRLGGNFSASPILAGGHIYFCNEQGETYLIKPGPTAGPVRKQTLDGHILASPAAVGKSLYIRTDKALYCLEEASISE